MCFVFNCKYFITSHAFDSKVDNMFFLRSAGVLIICFLALELPSLGLHLGYASSSILGSQISKYNVVRLSLNKEINLYIESTYQNFRIIFAWWAVLKKKYLQNSDLAGSLYLIIRCTELHYFIDVFQGEHCLLSWIHS